MKRLSLFIKTENESLLNHHKARGLLGANEFTIGKMESQGLRMQGLKHVD
jgi:hypothetical protein